MGVLRFAAAFGYAAFLIVGVKVQERAKERAEVESWLRGMRSYRPRAWDRWYATHAGR